MIVLIIVSCLLLVSIFVCYNLLRKNEKLEDIIKKTVESEPSIHEEDDDMAYFAKLAEED